MASYIIRRCLAAALMVLVVCSIVFIALYLVPGDPAVILLSAGGVIPPESAVEALRVELGLDRPIIAQYFAFLADLARGDLGRSFADGSPVMETILLRLPRTLELILAATALALLVGMPLGVLAAVRQGETLDRALSFAASVALSVPVFVLGTAVIYVFAKALAIAPAGGFVPFSEAPGRHLVLLLMPAASIAVGFSAVVFRMSRATTAAVQTRDWVRTARAKGLREPRVLRRHIVRNALGPVATIVGLQMGSMLGGSVLIEYVFNWPGLSGYLVTAIENRDYPEVRGVVLVVATLFILLNLLVDLLYMVLDPKVRRT